MWAEGARRTQQTSERAEPCEAWRWRGARLSGRSSEVRGRRRRRNRRRARAGAAASPNGAFVRPSPVLQAEVAALTREGPAGWNLDSHQLQCPSAACAHPRGGSLGSQVPSGDSPSHTSVPGVQSKRGPNAGAEPRTKVTKSLPAGVCVPRCLRRARASRDRPRPRRMSRRRGGGQHPPRRCSALLSRRCVSCPSVKWGRSTCLSGLPRH